MKANFYIKINVLKYSIIFFHVYMEVLQTGFL